MYLSKFYSVFRGNMDRSRKENLLTNAERKRKWWQKNWEEDLKQKREAYVQKQETISTKELRIQLDVAHVRKAMSRQKLKLNASTQKLQGMKLKGRNRKQKEQKEEKKTPEKIKMSTKRVWKHCETLNIKFDFKKGNSRVNKSKELRRKKIQEEFSLLESAEEKTTVLTSTVNKQSPSSEKPIQNAGGSSNVLSPVKRALKVTRKHCNASVRSSRKALLSVVATLETNGSSHCDIRSFLGEKWLSHVRAKNSISIDTTIIRNIHLSTKKLIN